MLRLRLGASNFYLKTGLLLLAISVVSYSSVYIFWPSSELTRSLIKWVAAGSFLGGLVIYFTGRVSHALSRREAA